MFYCSVCIVYHLNRTVGDTPDIAQNFDKHKPERVNVKYLITTGIPTVCDMQAHMHEVITEMSSSPKVVLGQLVLPAHQQLRKAQCV